MALFSESERAVNIATRSTSLSTQPWPQAFENLHDASIPSTPEYLKEMTSNQLFLVPGVSEDCFLELQAFSNLPIISFPRALYSRRRVRLLRLVTPEEAELYSPGFRTPRIKPIADMVATSTVTETSSVGDGSIHPQHVDKEKSSLSNILEEAWGKSSLSCPVRSVCPHPGSHISLDPCRLICATRDVIGPTLRLGD
ncbi:unnamed protein product [Protopolystoma xenopodis]|uniref:Uncharacterized protein n=1 Tax=Protopolystoma xenopodis TaxID=117903 RepID=A0A448XGM5_9PLAT|nr:unnamed protein product [Protopolystoma xenopodis]